MVWGLVFLYQFSQHVHVLVPVQMFGKVNPQELVAVHSLDLNMAH